MRVCLCLYFVVAVVIDLLHAALELTGNMNVPCHNNNSVAVVDHLSSAVQHACTLLSNSARVRVPTDMCKKMNSKLRYERPPFVNGSLMFCRT